MIVTRIISFRDRLGETANGPPNGISLKSFRLEGDSACVCGAVGYHETPVKNNPSHLFDPPRVTDPAVPESRWIELEVLLMHLQHDYEQLNSEVLKQQKIIDQQQQRMTALENLVHRLLAQMEHGPTSA